jgi:hypothetical protein
MSVMIKKTIWVLLAVAVLAFVLGTTVRADERNTKSLPLANASKAVVPAIAIDVTSLSLTDLETVPIVAVAPDQADAAITAVIQTRPLPNIATRVSAVDTGGVMHPVQKASHATYLPQTASALPLIVLLSAVSIGVAFGLMVFGKRRPASTA